MPTNPYNYGKQIFSNAKEEKLEKDTKDNIERVSQASSIDFKPKKIRSVSLHKKDAENFNTSQKRRNSLLPLTVDQIHNSGSPKPNYMVGAGFN